MAKRRANKQLKKDDLNSDPEAEVSGELQKADSSALVNRVIRKGKRRDPDTSESPSPLVNFAGFSTAPQGAPFSFFGKKDEPKPQPEKKEPTSSDVAALAVLNISFSNWIRQNLEKNPYVILLPVFKDYEKHLATLNFDSSGVVTTSEPRPSFSAKPSATATATFNSGTLESSHATASAAKGSSSPSATSTGSFLTSGKTTGSSATSGTTTGSFSTSKTTAGIFSSSGTKTGSFLTSGKTTGSSATSGTTTGSFSTSKTTAGIFSSSGTKTGSFLTSGKTTGSSATSGTTTGSFSTSKTTAGIFSSLGTRTGSFLWSGTTVGGSKSSETSAGGWMSGWTSSTTPGDFTATSAGSVTKEGVPSNTAPPSGAEAEAEPSDEPPQFDFVPVGEEGAVFNIRCKVFLKKNGTFASVGVGTLYLKPLPGGKTQLITRADTAQGSVLLNLIITPDLPLQRTGKNNLLLVCVPTPDAKPPPVPVLIRLKSEEERNRLLGELEMSR